MDAAEIAEMDSELGSGSGSVGSGSGMVSEGAPGQSNNDVVVGIVVGAVSLVALLSIAAVVFVLVRGSRRREEELQLQCGGDVEPADPTDLGGQVTSIKRQLDDQRAWCQKRYGNEWMATDYSARLAEARAALSRPKTDAPVQAAGVAVVLAKELLIVEAKETPSLSSSSVSFPQELQAASQPEQGDEDDAGGYQDSTYGHQESGSYGDGHDGSDALSPSGSGRRRRSQQPSSLDPLVQAGAPDQQVQQAAQARPEFDHSKFESEWMSVDRIQERMTKGLNPLLPEAATRTEAATGALEVSQLLQRGSYQHKQRSGGVPPGWPSDAASAAPAPVRSVPPDIAGAALPSAPGPIRPVPPGVVADWQQVQHDDEYDGGEYGGEYDGQHAGIYGGEYGSEYGGKYNAQHERTYGEYGQHEENNGEYGGEYGGEYDGQHQGMYGGEYDVQYDGPYGAGVVIEPMPQPPQLNQDADAYQPSWMQRPQLNKDVDDDQPSVQSSAAPAILFAPPQPWPLSPAMLGAEAKAAEEAQLAAGTKAAAVAEAVAAAKAVAMAVAKAATAAAAAEEARLAAEVEAAEVARVGAEVVHYSPAAVRGSAAEQLFGRVLSPTKPPPPPMPPTRRRKTRRRLVDAEGRLSSLSNIGEAGESFARPKAEETTAREDEYEYSRPSSRASEDAAAEPAAEPAAELAAELAAKPPPPPPPPRRRRSQQSKLHRAATEPPPAEEAPSLEAQRDESNVEAE